MEINIFGKEQSIRCIVTSEFIAVELCDSGVIKCLSLPRDSKEAQAKMFIIAVGTIIRLGLFKSMIDSIILVTKITVRFSDFYLKY